MIKYQFSVYQADDSRKWSQFLCAFSGECSEENRKFILRYLLQIMLQQRYWHSSVALRWDGVVLCRLL